MRASSEDNFYKAGWWNGIDDPEAGLKGHALAIDYQANGLDMTVFCTSITNKAHRTDDYRLATNAIYSKLLGADFTVESDDVEGRVKTYEAIVKGEPIPQPGIPESFRVMLKELQSLGMDVIVQDKDGNEIDMRQNFDDEETGFDMRDVAGTETVVQESELTDYNIKDADAGFDDPSVLEDDNSGAEAPAASDEVDF